MNVHLIPFGLPHRAGVGLWLAGAAAMWWGLASVIVAWSPAAGVGTWWLGGLAALVGGLGQRIGGSWGTAVAASAIAAGVAVVGHGLGSWVVATEQVMLRSHLPGWASAGVGVGIAWLALARGPDLDLTVRHLAGGAASGGFAAAAWHAVAHYPWLGGDPWVALLVGAVVFGLCVGVLCRPAPRRAYGGWVVAHPGERWIEVTQEERFVGHYGRGVDVVLPAESGVAALHASFVRAADGRFVVRGLTRAPTQVVRALERVDLRFDPARPAPVETALQHGDRIELGAEGVSLTFVRWPEGAS